MGVQNWRKVLSGGAAALYIGGVWFLWDLADRLINWGYWTIEDAHRYRRLPVFATIGWTLLWLLGVLVAWKGRAVWRRILFLGTNLKLLFFGQVELHRRVNESADAGLFSRIAGIERYRGDNYHIVYTHKGSHPHRLGQGKRYRIPGFPFDEVEVIMYVWYLISRNFGFTLNQIRPRCSCCTSDAAERADVLDSSYALIGSPKGNAFCRELMRELRNASANGGTIRRPPYLMRLERAQTRDAEDHPDSDTIPEDPKTKDASAVEILCCLQGNNAMLRPTATANAVDGQEMRDYALLMRVSGKVKKYPVLIIAGCKAAGQTALTEYLQDRRNLESLSETYGGKDFFVVLRVDYKYKAGGLPELDPVKPYEVHDQGPIDFNL
jgi:hypothetical protein